MLSSLRSLARKSFRSEQGSVAVVIGLAMTVIIGMVALGTEVTFLLYKQRQLQSATDSAAHGGAIALAKGYPTDPKLEARAIAASLGFVGGAADVTMTVNIPPLSGPHVGDAKAVEVIIGQPQDLSLVTLFRSGLFDVRARSVGKAGSGSGGGNFCVLQLNTGTATGVTLASGANVTLTSCGIAANSKGNPSLLVRDGSSLTTQSLISGGTVSALYGSSINSAEAVKINQPAVADPYAAVAMPSYSGCGGGTNRNYGHGTWSLSPGVYCNNLRFSSDAVVTLNPGVYVINRGTLTIGDNVRVTGTGVTIFLTSSTGSNYANIVTTGSSRTTLTAPTTGTYAGIVFFGSRNAPRTTINEFSNDSTVIATGAIYLPTQTVRFLNSSKNQANCTQLVAATIENYSASNWGFKNECTGTGVKAIGGGPVTATGLVE